MTFLNYNFKYVIKQCEITTNKYVITYILVEIFNIFLYCFFIIIYIILELNINFRSLIYNFFHMKYIIIFCFKYLIIIFLQIR